MRIGAVGGAIYSPYVYNTNTVSSASLNKVKGISDDVLSSKTDFSGLSTQENTNPLGIGQSQDYAGIFDMQMQLSRMNEARIFG